MTGTSESSDAQAIAIIGMAGRFPAAGDIDELWSLLREGREAYRPLSDQALRDAGVSEDLIADPDYVKAEMVGPAAEVFDAGFFGYNPHQASLIDPQQRMFLECAWEALESAGYCTDHHDGSIGVFAGSGTSFHLWRLLASSQDGEAALFNSVIDSDKDFLTTRVSYKMGLTGPSVCVQTACSTSLVAIHMAVQSLLAFECDTALAGGVSLKEQSGQGHLYIPNGIVSADGHCRAYDAQATGMALGSGAGVVALKRLEDALAEGAPIHAVIRATAINNDGSDKVGFTAPGLNSQIRLIATALAVAGLDPEDIGLIEGHGTGTKLGDMIELTALHDVFGGSGRTRSCALGSIKSNIGHLDTASGVTGLIKATLCLKHGTFVPSLHVTQPNDVLQSPESPFFIPARETPWPKSPGRPRRAGVSSLGIGGTNAHAVLEEPPAREPRISRGLQIFPVSAASAGAFQRNARALAAAVASSDEALADIAFTLQIGRKAMAYRGAVIAGERQHLSHRLLNLAAEAPTEASGQMVLLFPSRTRNLIGAAHRLCTELPRFREDLDRCAQALEQRLGYDVRATLCDGVVADEHVPAALFALEYCLGKLWLSWGLRPDACVGEGVGELAAACVAGIVPFDRAVAVLAGALGRTDAVAARQADADAMQGDEGLGIACFGIGRGRLDARIDLAQWSRELLVPATGPSADLLGAPAQYVLEVLPDAGLAQRVKAAGMLAGNAALRAPADGCPLDHAELLELLASLWCAGADLDWRKLHVDSAPLRVVLPTYRFERERCPIPAAMPTPSKAMGVQAKPDERGAPEDWLYIPSCAATAAPGPPGANVEGKVILVLAGPGRLEEVVDRIRVLGGKVVVVAPGAAFRRDEDRYELRTESAEDYCRLFDDLSSAGLMPDGIIHAWSLDEAGTIGGDPFLAEQGAGWVSVLLLLQAWHAREGEGPKALLALTTGLYAAPFGQGAGGSRAASLASLCQVISQEEPELRLNVLDVPLDDGGDADGRYADWIVAELVRPSQDMTFAYRGNRRLRTAWEPVRLDETPVRSLQTDGVYLIVGGLGAIGLALARHLSANHQARVALVSRTRLPPRQEWPDLIAQGVHPHCRTLAVLSEIERAGGTVFTVAADVGSKREMAEAVEQVEEVFGRIAGVFHLAMAQDGSGNRPWQELSASDLSNQLAPKLSGFRVLEQVFRHRKIDFGVVFSSNSAILGGFGFGAYAASNAALDAAVTEGSPLTPRWLCINWPGWRVLKPADADARAGGDEVAAILDDQTVIDSAEGCRVLDMIITRSTVPHVAVHPTSLPLAFETWARHRARCEPPASSNATGPMPPAQSSDLQAEVVELLKSSLGVDHIRTTDMFVDLGGNSLIALRVQHRVRKRFGVLLPPRLLMDTPLVPGIVDHVRHALAQGA